jgi:hypothetical protein
MTKMTKVWGGKKGENRRIDAKMSKASKMTAGRKRYRREDSS